MQLEVNNLIAGYEGVEVLHNISLNVDKGDIVSIIGPNGAGKTTLARAIYGVIKPDKGRVVFNGEDLVGLRPFEVIKRGISYAPQDGAIFRQLTVEENLEMGAYLLEEGYEKRLEEIISLFPRLKERMKQLSSTLSGGERQMLALGRALMLEPELLIVDEPSLGLQPTLVDETLEKISEINENAEVTILMIEQAAPRALELSDKIYVLATGEIKFEGKPDELKEDEELSAMYMKG